MSLFASTPCCSTRRAAEVLGAFIYSEEHKGWIFPDMPKRTAKRPWKAEDHTGEPYVYHDCPYCGSELKR